MSSNDNIVQIGLASDDRYYPGLFATAVSMAKFADESVKLVFNIIDGGIEFDEMRRLISSIREFHTDSEINLFKLSNIKSNLFPSKMNYARLLLPRLLSHVDHLIYCDVDFLWMANISQLWKLRNEGFFIQSTQDIGFTQMSEARWLSKKGIEINPERYFCSGLLLMNLKLFRYDIDRKLSDFIKTHSDIPLFDQTALNAILLPMDKGVDMLPAQWQRNALLVSDSDFLSPMAIHFSGLCPWARMRVIPDIVVLWMRTMADLQKRNFGEIRCQYYGILKYYIGRIIFFFLCMPFFKNFVVLFTKSMRGTGYSLYVRAILRHINIKKTSIR